MAQERWLGNQPIPMDDLPPHPGAIEVWHDGRLIAIASDDLDPSVCYHRVGGRWVPVVRVEWLELSDRTHVCRRIIGPAGQTLALELRSKRILG